VSESNTNPPEEFHPFDVEEFARTTIQTIEYSDAMDSVLEDRVIRIEECIAARWPRRWLLWARLRRELRASVAGFDPDFIPRGDFIRRRWEVIGQMTNDRPEVRRHHEEQTKGWQKHSGWDAAQPPAAGEQGGADPAAGYLP